MTKGYVFRRELDKVSAGATNEDLDFGPLEAHTVRAIEGISVIDETTGATRAIVLAGRYGVERQLMQSGALTLGVVYRFTDGFYLGDRERVIVRFVGTTSGDVLKAIIDGEVKYYGEEPVLVDIGG